jgi:hypothetical protein
MSVNLEILKELLTDWKNGDLTYSEMIELRDKLTDVKDDLERVMDVYDAE